MINLFKNMYYKKKYNTMMLKYEELEEQYRVLVINYNKLLRKKEGKK